MQRKHEVAIDVIHPDVETYYKNENKNKNESSNLIMCAISTIALLILGVTQLYATIK
jgi:hypothetical protein